MPLLNQSILRCLPGNDAGMVCEVQPMSDFELISIMLAMISLLITVAIAAYKAGRSNKK